MSIDASYGGIGKRNVLPSEVVDIKAVPIIRFNLKPKKRKTVGSRYSLCLTSDSVKGLYFNILLISMKLALL